jgi:hypothetical protein
MWNYLARLMSALGLCVLRCACACIPCSCPAQLLSAVALSQGMSSLPQAGSIRLANQPHCRLRSITGPHCWSRSDRRSAVHQDQGPRGRMGRSRSRSRSRGRSRGCSRDKGRNRSRSRSYGRHSYSPGDPRRRGESRDRGREGYRRHAGELSVRSSSGDRHGCRGSGRDSQRHRSHSREHRHHGANCLMRRLNGTLRLDPHCAVS